MQDENFIKHLDADSYKLKYEHNFLSISFTVLKLAFLCAASHKHIYMCVCVSNTLTASIANVQSVTYVNRSSLLTC